MNHHEEFRANAFGLVLKTKQFLAGNCTREDVLRFAHDKGLLGTLSEEDQLAALELLTRPDGET